MNIREYKIEFINRLNHIYDLDQIDVFFYMIVSHIKNISRVDLALNPSLSFTNEELFLIDKFVLELLDEKPIQYILGLAHFYSLDFIVNKSVLIPRQETEELVDWIIKDFSNKNNISILDIGTGSGCIPITLAKHLTSEVTSFDISYDAIQVAQQNADNNQVFVRFVEFDILNDEWEGDSFNVIVSNPPYVRNLEKTEIKNNVLNFEPHLALFVEDDKPLIFYDKIADFALKHLSYDGVLYFEINQYLGNEMVSLLKSKKFKNIELRKDVYGNDRMIKATLN